MYVFRPFELLGVKIGNILSSSRVHTVCDYLDTSIWRHSSMRAYMYVRHWHLLSETW